MDTEASKLPVPYVYRALLVRPRHPDDTGTGPQFASAEVGGAEASGTPGPVRAPGTMPLPIAKLIELLRADAELKTQTDAAAWARVDAMYAQYMVCAARLP